VLWSVLAGPFVLSTYVSELLLINLYHLVSWHNRLVQNVIIVCSVILGPVEMASVIRPKKAA
jgi:hypothetical protein